VGGEELSEGSITEGFERAEFGEESHVTKMKNKTDAVKLIRAAFYARRKNAPH
jgi:hypothetical protein